MESSLTGGPGPLALFWPYILLAAVIVQRIAELAWSELNRRRLMARRGREIGGAHYPLFIALHALWLAVMVLAVLPGAPFRPVLFGIFVALQLLRIWTIASLGPFWTTRIITVDDQPLRRRGPYRFIRHPNYLIVAIEIPLLPLLLDLPVVAIAFGVANLALLVWRIRIEEEALKPRRHLAEPTRAAQAASSV